MELLQLHLAFDLPELSRASIPKGGLLLVEVRCWRAGDDLFFASIGHFGEGLKAALAANRPPERHVLLDADSVNFVDTSACDALTNVIKELQKPRHHLRLRPCA